MSQIKVSQIDSKTIGSPLVILSPLTVSDSTPSTTPISGSITTNGGIGILKNANIGGVLSVSSALASTTKNTGAITTNGGIGIGGSANIGGSATIAGNTVISGVLNINSALASSSTITGSITTNGGIGILGSANIGGGIYANSVSLQYSPFAWDGRWPQCVMKHWAQRETYQMTYQLSDALLYTAYTQSGRISVLDTTITPRRASSKIRVSFNITGESSYNSCVFRLYRIISGVVAEIGAADWADIGTVGGTLGSPTYGGNRLQYYGHKVLPYDADNNSTPVITCIDYLDSPNTTAAVTYFVVIYNANKGIFTLNSTKGDTANTGGGSAGNWEYERGTSQCILQEFFV